MATPRELSRPTDEFHTLTAERDSTRQADALILESVDETLGDLLGKSVREIVYDCLEKYCSIARSEIPMNLDEFVTALNEAFGKNVGRMISREVYAKLTMRSLESTNAECRDYVELARAKLDQ